MPVSNRTTASVATHRRGSEEQAPTDDEDSGKGRRAEIGPEGIDIGSFLPHEGARWTSLRDKAVKLPQFQRYAKRVAEGALWSLDEAFLSFCLDR